VLCRPSELQIGPAGGHAALLQDMGSLLMLAASQTQLPCSHGAQSVRRPTGCCPAQHLMGFAASRLGTALMVWLPGGALYFAVILYSAAVMVNFLGCGWFLVARVEGFDGTWLSRVGAAPAMPLCLRGVVAFVAQALRWLTLLMPKLLPYIRLSTAGWQESLARFRHQACKTRHCLRACASKRLAAGTSCAHAEADPCRSAESCTQAVMPAGRAGSEDFSHAPPWRQYLAALYFTITTLSTTGFGDIVAQNSLEQARASPLVLTLRRADRGGALRCRLLARARACSLPGLSSATADGKQCGSHGHGWTRQLPPHACPDRCAAHGRAGQPAPSMSTGASAFAMHCDTQGIDPPDPYVFR